MTETHADMQQFHSKTSWMITENDFNNICLVIANFHILAANITIDCTNYCKKGQIDPFMISSSKIFITDKVSEWSKGLSTQFTAPQVLTLLRALEAVNKGTTDAAGKFWLTDYAMLPEFVSKFLEEKLGSFFHSVSNTQSSVPTQSSRQSTPAKSPFKQRTSPLKSPVKGCRSSPRLKALQKSPVECDDAQTTSNQPYKSLRKKSRACMVVTDAVSDSDGEVGEIEFDPTNEAGAAEVYNASQKEVPLEALLTPPCAAETNVDNLEQENSCLEDSLLSLEPLLEILPPSIQTEWGSKFVPTLAQVDIQKHPEDFKTFQECVIINTDPLPNDTQAAVS